jgi:UDP-glucose 4-epimerase
MRPDPERAPVFPARFLLCMAHRGRNRRRRVADGRMDQVLVIGGSGRVGRMLARAWVGDGLRPVIQYRAAPLGVNLPHLRWSPGSEPLPLAKFKAMIVLAGVVPGRGDLAQNATIAQACLTAAQAAGIGKVLIASSSAVYGVNDGTPFAETDALHPVNDYGRAKRTMEAALAPFRAQGTQVCALRIGNVAGADALLLNLAAGGVVQVDQFADGAGPLRSYIGPLTMARVMASLTTQVLPEVLNLAAPHPVAMNDLAQAARANWSWHPAPATAHQRITLDCRRLTALCPIDKACSTAQAMVDEWQLLRGQA